MNSKEKALALIKIKAAALKLAMKIKTGVSNVELVLREVKKHLDKMTFEKTLQYHQHREDIFEGNKKVYEHAFIEGIKEFKPKLLLIRDWFDKSMNPAELLRKIEDYIDDLNEEISNMYEDNIDHLGKMTAISGRVQGAVFVESSGHNLLNWIEYWKKKYKVK